MKDTPDARGLVALVLALVALGWIGVALWPAAAMPAWPSVSAGLLALGLALGRGRPVVRAFAAIFGSTAAVLGALQIAALWAFASLVPPA